MSEMSREDALAHFGVKGMKWGVRRSENRALNKASKAKDKAERVATIDAARARVSSGQSRQEYKQARAQYKVNKKVMGSREAKKILHAARDKFLNDLDTSSQAKNGSEAVQQLMAAYATDKLIRDLTTR